MNRLQKRFFISLFIFVFISITIPSCYYDDEQTLYPKACDTTTATFLSKIQPIINKNCLPCHSTTNSSGGISLEGYDNINSSVQNQSLMNAINHSPGFQAMPKGGAKLSDCDISNLNSWITSGALNN